MQDRASISILQPGIHRTANIEDYYRDPCPTPSLTQSLAKTLLHQSPLHAWHGSARLNPNHEPKSDTKFDLGTLAHALLLGRSRSITVVEAADWRTKQAKEQRAAIEAAGGIAVLPHVMARASAMVNACRAHLARLGIEWDNAEDSEVVIVWQELVRDGNAKRPVWFRSLIDRLTSTGVWDYKTTEGSASPDTLTHKLVTDGWDIQAAMHERGLSILDPNAVRQPPGFIVQEAHPPYAVTVARLDGSAMAMGAAKLQMAAETWAQCLRRDRWPGYGAGQEVMLSMPEWHIREVEYQAAVRAMENTSEAMADG